jgi:pseudouridine synthase
MEVAKKMVLGVDIGEGDGVVRAKKAEYLQNNFFRITLNEGKKRQIRRMLEVLGFKVLDLKRTEISGLKIGNLREGEWTYLSEAEIRQLKSY